jgi:hypothetical protein
MFTLVPNENFDEELKQKKNRNSEEHQPLQQVLNDNIYYYELKIVTIIMLPGVSEVEGGRRTYGNTTHYSYDEGELDKDRKSKINQYSGNNAFRPTIHPTGEVDIIRPADGGSRVEINITTISYVQRPSRIPKPRDNKYVETLNGTFLENSAGSRR